MSDSTVPPLHPHSRLPAAPLPPLPLAVAAPAPGPSTLLVIGDRERNPELAALDALPASSWRVAGVVSGEGVLALGEEALGRVDAVLVCVGTGKDDLQPAWPHLKRSVSWVHSSFAGLEHFLFAELAAAEGVTFTNAKGCFSASLAEFALFGAKYFMLDYDRARMNKVQKAWAPYFVDELRTMTMGIVGYGSIGAACARLAKAYQMRVVGLRRSGEGAEGVERMYTPDQLCDMMRESDVIVNCLPHTAMTTGFVDRAAIAAMKPSAVFVNVGRGKTVDEGALVEALREKRIRGAALDVAHTEPLPADSPLWGLDNLVLTPHCADKTRVMARESLELFVNNARRFANGQQLLNQVDPKAGY